MYSESAQRVPENRASLLREFGILETYAEYRSRGDELSSPTLSMASETDHIVSGGLLRLLANTFVLLYKARHLSWRVNGALANGVRAIVLQDHRDLDEAADGIARRILALKGEVPPSYGDLVRSSSIRQELRLRSEMAMVLQIVGDHAQILADIDTLQVLLPLDRDTKSAELLKQIAESHRRCRESLGGLLRRNGRAPQQ